MCLDLAVFFYLQVCLYNYLFYIMASIKCIIIFLTVLKFCRFWRNVWRYQSRRKWIERWYNGEIIQWRDNTMAKEKRRKDKHWSINHYTQKKKRLCNTNTMFIFSRACFFSIILLNWLQKYFRYLFFHIFLN